MRRRVAPPHLVSTNRVTQEWRDSAAIGKATMRRRHWAKLTTATALAIILGSVPLRAETPVQTDATLGIPLPEQPELKLLDAERPASPQATAAHSGDASEAEIVTGTVSAGG